MNRRSDAVPRVLAALTPREREVFWLVAERLRNREIAERLHVSERTVESHVASLLRKLGGSDRTALIALGERLRERPPGSSELPTILSSFVGRDAEVVRLWDLVRRDRLVTLTGPAGVGKTRLALQVARAAADMPAPILVDLATITAGGEVDRAFSSALGLVEDERGLRASLRDALRDGRHWLIVDNCEHVLEGIAVLLGDLLTAAAGLRVLTTSRSPLRVTGEVVHEVEPLGLPPDSDDPAAILGVASGRLFADRAAISSPGFAVAPGNARAVAAVCRRVDGLPLAIELAAARIRTFSPAELLAHLDDRFALLGGGSRDASGRHRTLEAALRWSYELLDEEERLLFERCSVFPGEFDYDTAVGVLAFPPLEPDGFLRIFPRLLDRSLLSSRRVRDRTTYRMLESFRAFGRQHLERRGSAGKVDQRHAVHHIDRAVAAVPDLMGGDQVAALRWFDRRWVDLRAAMRWSLSEGRIEQAWRLLADIGRRWQVIGIRGELFDWLEELLGRPLPSGDLGLRARLVAAFLLCFTDTGRAARLAAEAHDLASTANRADRAMAELTLGWTLGYLDRDESAVEHLERAVEQFRRLGDPWHEALALQGLGHAVHEVDATVDHLGRSAQLFGRLHDDVMRANCLTMLAARLLEAGQYLEKIRGWLAEARRLAERTGSTHELLHVELHDARLRQYRGDHRSAARAFRQLLPSLRRVGDHRCASRCLFGLGWAAVVEGDDTSAHTHLMACVTLADRVKDPREAAAALRLLSDLAERAGHIVQAARLLGAADAAADRLDPARRDGLPADHELLERIRDRIGSADLEAALREGFAAAPAQLLMS